MKLQTSTLASSFASHMWAGSLDKQPGVSEAHSGIGTGSSPNVG